MRPKSVWIAVILCAVLLVSSPLARAYMDEVVILENEEIVKLKDQPLIDTYIDVIVEMEATKTFHTTSGFTPKEYTAFKNLLRYRIRLLMEMHKRGLEVPALDK